MKNNELGKVAIGSGRHPKSRFNLSHDVNSTYQFGEVQPVLFRDMIAGEKDVVDIESMVRLAPMVAPTFGRIKHKEWHHFIPMKDLFPHYGNFLSETTFANSISTKLPHMTLGALSYFCLVGSKMTIYYDKTSNTDPNNLEKDLSEFRLFVQPDVNTTTTDVTNLLTWLLTDQGLTSPQMPFDFIINQNVAPWSAAHGNFVNLRYFNPLDKILFASNAVSYTWRNSLYIPTTNFDTTSWFDFADKTVTGTNYAYVTDLEPVLLDSADAVLADSIKDSSNNNHDVLYAFRLSNFGKRLYKILVGLGYQLDFNSTQKVSLLPLFAFYKAWFDNFGLTRYKSWQDTAAYRILFKFDLNTSYPNFDNIFVSGLPDGITSVGYADFCEFIAELGNCWFTEETDFVTAHLISDIIGPTGNDMFTSVPDIVSQGVPNPVTSAYTSGQMTSYGPMLRPTAAYYNNSRLSALKVKELMDMYRWCNRNTIAGKAIEDLLRAQGFGYFLYSCKSNFIGYTEQTVQVYDVVSSSDTYNSTSNDGALLGQYAGRGLGYDKSKTMVFEADEDGYWIGLCAIVPESGYSQGLNPSLLALTKFDRYNPDLDGKYLTLSSKSVVQGSMPFGQRHLLGALQNAYGFIPIYTGLKIAQNVSNGGFSLRSQRDVFRPYMLDKVIDVGERRVVPTGSSSTSRDFEVMKIFKDLPVAGEYWKYLGRYPWLGNFDRIFAHAEVNTDLLNQVTQLDSITDSSFEYCVVSDDNLMVHHVVNQVAYSPMLPIEQSFNTQDEDGDFDTSLEKA